MPTSPPPPVSGGARAVSEQGPGVGRPTLFTLRAQNAHLDVLEGLQSDHARAYAAEVTCLLAWFDLVALDQGTCTDLAALELAPAMRTGQHQAGTLLADAVHLRDRLPVLRAALTAGTIWRPQATVLIKETHDCSAAVCAAVEARLLGPDGTGAAGQLAPGDLGRAVRRAVLAAQSELEAEQQAERERDAKAARDVTMRPARNGMVHLFALLTIEQALGHSRDLDALCRKLAAADRAAGITRTAAQRRADILAMLPSIALHAWDHPAHPGTPPAAATGAPATPGTNANSAGTPGDAGSPSGSTGHDASEGGPGGPDSSPGWAGCPFGPGGVPAAGLGPGVELIVHTPMATALGLSQEPGEILGYGLISAAAIRRLLPDARLRRLIVDDQTGQPLHRDSNTVVPPPRTERARPPEQRLDESPPLPRPPDPAGTSPGLDATAPSGNDPDPRSDAARRVMLGWLGPQHDSNPAPGVLIATPGSTLRPVHPSELNDTHEDAGLTGAPGEVWLIDPPEHRHDPSTGLTRFLSLRDPLCTGPGCSTAASRCDLDHERAYRTGEQPGGTTTAANLSPKSRRCHRAKTPHRDNPHPWTSVRNHDGSTTWTSPLGRAHTRPGYWSPAPAPGSEPNTEPRADPPALPGGADGQLWWQLICPVDPGLHTDLSERLATRTARLASTKKAQRQAAKQAQQDRAMQDGVDRLADPFCTAGPVRTSAEPFADAPPF